MKRTLSSARFILMLLSVLTLFSFKCGPVNSAPKPVASFNLITEKQFNDLFPQRNSFYTYSAFIKAIRELSLIKVKVTRRAVSVYQLMRTDKSAGKSTIIRQDPDWNEPWAKTKPDSTYTIDYGNFCTEGNMQVNKKELAAFFSNIAHETRLGMNGTYTDGLMETHEANTSLDYIADNDTYPAVKGKKYYGRGPMQISYNGNYGYASDCIFGDKKILLNNPDLVDTDPVTSFKTAIYFWMTPQTYKPSSHDVMVGKWKPNAADKAAGRISGFGEVIDIINGGLECNKGENTSMADRIAYYQHFLTKLGVTDPNCACNCAKMKPYPN